ncbi:MAG: DHH family phosphoesterase [Deltaproteobacteria bacterium]|nr:DHH family phosphoesterase [Deltaproteobacteria bacterium]
MTEFNIPLADFTQAFGNTLDTLRDQQKKMLVTMHRWLDGDAYGSALAFGLMLRKLDVDSTIMCVPFIPDKFQFLIPLSGLHILEGRQFTRGYNNRADFTKEFQDYLLEKQREYGALTILDCAGSSQVPEEVWSVSERFPCIINIDHHVGYALSHPQNRVLNLVGNCSATGEVLYHLMSALRLEIDSNIAVPLYVGITADLRKNDIEKGDPDYPGRIMRLLRSKVKIMPAGIQEQIADIFLLDPWEKALLKKTTQTARVVKNIVHVTFDPDMVFEAKRDTDSLHNPRMPFHEFHIQLRQWLRQYRKECQFVLIFDKILSKVSIFDLYKSGKFDLARISQELGGGGGHANRAGFSFQTAKEKLIGTQGGESSVPDDVTRDRIIEFIRQRLSVAPDL